MSSCSCCQALTRMIDAYYQNFEDHYKQSGKYQYMHNLFEPRKFVKLGLLEDKKTSRDCVSCQNIINNVFQDGERLTPTSADVEILDGFLYMSIESPLQQPMRVLRLHRVEPRSLAYPTARTCGPQQLDIALLRKWIDRCQASHGSECLSSTISPPSHKIYLIDTDVGCLVHKGADCRYVALSYVWGQNTRAQTTKSNLPALQTPGSITAEAEQLTIPKTIRNALELVFLLGERYLWVDSFCIVQDDEDTKELQLSSMASIYANAYFTIAAAEGKDADHGISGIGGSADARKIDDGMFRLSNGNQMIAYGTGESALGSAGYTTWNTRGWTFQEGLFSRRILLFNGPVSWYCRSSTWNEALRDPTEDLVEPVGLRPPRIYQELAHREPKWPDLDHWASLVLEYNKRKLTFDADVINAFSGVAAIFQRHFNGGLLWGIPEMFFDHCIIWRPLGALRRRRPDNDSSRVSRLPSWSWAGWEGLVYLQGFRTWIDRSVDSIYDGVYDGVHDDDYGQDELQPMVEWYKSKTSNANASVLVSVKNTFHSIESAHRHKEPEACPDGWTKKTTPQGKPYYINESVSSTRFRLPIPLSNHDIASMPDNESRFLFFRAQHAWFLIGQDVRLHDWQPRSVKLSRRVKLCDPLGKWAGSLMLHTSLSGPLPIGESCELLALSLATFSTDHFFNLGLDRELPPLYKTSEAYKFYNVMWIEWESGIAFRKAVGKVDKDVWDQQNPRTIDVVLG